MSIITNNLPELAASIRQEHHLAEQHAMQAVNHAMEAGRLLIEAKALCSHGKWLSWLADNFEGSARTAQAKFNGVEIPTNCRGSARTAQAKFLHEAGEVIEQSKHVFTLLTPEANLTRHCAAISALPPEQYAPMLALLLEHGWSVKAPLIQITCMTPPSSRSTS